MRVTSPVLNLDIARVSQQGRVVTFSDPSSPWTVQVRLRRDGREIEQIRVDVKPGRVPITLARLARLPIAGMVHRAAASGAHPNEAFFRMLARPKQPGQVHWDPEHWDEVLAIYEWGETTGRPGGGRRAVADLWGVAVDPTVRRWLLIARGRDAAGALGPVAS